MTCLKRRKGGVPKKFDGGETQRHNGKSGRIDARHRRMEHQSVTLEDVIAKERRLEMVRHDLQIRKIRAEAALANVLPNFPPKFLCIRPIVRHDIMGDVSPDRQPFARFSYATYLSLCALIIVNIVVGLIGFATPNKADVDSKPWGTHFGITFLFLLGIPGAFMVWYFPLYTAITQGDSGKYTLSLFGLFLALCFDVYCAVGIFGFGGCGWLYVVGAQSDKKTIVTTVASIISGSLWSVHALLYFYLWSKMRQFSSIDEVRSMGLEVVNPDTGIVAGGTRTVGGSGVNAI